jgi:molybdenum cofactor synthesis domain-containing protein
MSKTAGIVIIGNEVLSGKTQDSNSHFFCAELRQLGVDVQKISTIPDEIELIGQEVAAFSKRFDWVFTSGGVGPTHDDVTIDGIARGFDLKVIRHPDIERGCQRLARVNEARREWPMFQRRGALTEAPAPIISVHNV